jgi:hypothetical protein
VPAYTRQPFDVSEPRTVVTDPVTARVAEVAAVGYEVVLHLLLRFFTHTSETEKQLSTLVGAAIDLMVSVVRPLGVALTHLPVGPEHPGVTAGAAFEMSYVMTNAVPAIRPAWTVLHERVALLASSCAALAHVDGVPASVGAAGERAAATAASLAAVLAEL